MTMKAVYQYNNPDSTTDMNAHFRILFHKGIVSGGTITPVGGTFQVSVAPFAAVSADGMVVEQDAATTLTIPSTNKGTVHHIVLIAQYNAPSAPTLQLQVMSKPTYEGSANTYAIILGSVTLAANSTSVLDANITYDYKDITAKIGSMNVKGALLSTDTPPNTQNKVGDLYVIYDTTPPYFVVWNGTSWIKFTDYSQLESDYLAHVTDHGAFTGTTAATDARHVTADMKAALAGTVGVPSADNKFVTESDSAKTLGTGERAGLTNAVGGTLSATNPVVSKGMSVLEERVVAYTSVTGGQAEATIAATISGTAVSVFVGTRGIEKNLQGTDVSTARQFFRVEDKFGKGLVIDGKAIYVQNVTINGVNYDTSSATTVSDEGFWDGTGALSVKFNGTITAGTIFYVRYNIRGKITALSPSNRETAASGRYAVPPTGYRNSIDSYVESYVVNANTVQASTISVSEAGYFAAGSEAAPSVTFSDDKLTGLFYAGTTDENLSHDYSGLGFAVNGQRMMVMGRAAQNIDINAYHILEADIDEEGHAFHKWSLHNGSGNERNVSFMFGTSNYLSDFDPAFGIRTGTYEENFGKLTTPYVSIQRDIAIESFTTAKHKLSVMSGGPTDPSLVFNRSNSGFYYFDQIGDAVHKMYKGVGVSVGSVPVAMFGLNAASVSGDDSILMVEKSLDEGMRLGLWSGGNGPRNLSIGYANYVTDWTELITVEMNSQNVVFKADVYADNSIIGQKIQGTNFVASNNGTATNPAFSFAGSYSDYGLYIQNPANASAQAFGSLLTVGVAGMPHVAFGRDPWTLGSSSAMANPLMINSFAKGATQFGYNISVPYMAGNVTGEWHSIRFGTSNYLTDFTESLTFSASTEGAAGWHLYDELAVEPGGLLSFYSSDSETSTEGISMKSVHYSTINDSALLVGGRICASDAILINSGSGVGKLVIGNGGFGSSLTAANSLTLQDWYNAAGNVGYLPNAKKAATANTVEDLKDAVWDLVKALGYNTTGGTFQLHSLFSY